MLFQDSMQHESIWPLAGHQAKIIPLMTYSERLHAAIQKKQTPALVGLDPRFEQLPRSIKDAASQQPGNNNEQQALAFETFCKELIDVVAPLVPIVKPQAAFFEELGPAGSLALFNVMQHARDAGLLVICDAKRGDIGSTAEAYARGYLAGEDASTAAWPSDSLTVNPYLGFDTLEPFVNTAIERNAGLYVLVRTSNPQSATLQDRVTDGQKVYEAVAVELERICSENIGSDGYGSIGAVVGATYPEELAELRKMMPHVPLLIPGYGAQGGGANDVAAAFDDNGLGAVVNSSRGINFAYKKEPYASEFGEDRWQEAVEAATKAMIADLAEHTPAGVLQQD